MRFRKLRIAFSATCLIACVLLIVLWVRSYWRSDNALGPMSKSTAVLLSSYHGRLSAIVEQIEIPKWDYSHNSRAEQLAATSSASVGRTFARLFVIRFISQKKNSGVSLPYTYPVLLTCALAVVPWIRHLRWSYSLRTLLIAVTLVAVVLGLIVWISRAD
jgi:hypothetical protein